MIVRIYFATYVFQEKWLGIWRRTLEHDEVVFWHTSDRVTLYGRRLKSESFRQHGIVIVHGNNNKPALDNGALTTNPKQHKCLAADYSALTAFFALANRAAFTSYMFSPASTSSEQKKLPPGHWNVMLILSALGRCMKPKLMSVALQAVVATYVINDFRQLIVPACCRKDDADSRLLMQLIDVKHERNLPKL
jgi:hypothetical protein